MIRAKLGQQPSRDTYKRTIGYDFVFTCATVQTILQGINAFSLNE
jgi:hypothetical protein